MDQVEIAERRLPVCVQFKKRSLGDEFVGCRDGIVAGTGNLSRSIFCELVFANLKTNIRPGALLWVKIRFDFGNGSHEAKIQPESIRCTLNLLKRCSN